VGSWGGGGLPGFRIRIIVATFHCIGKYPMRVGFVKQLVCESPKSQDDIAQPPDDYERTLRHLLQHPFATILTASHMKFIPKINFANYGS
jgi:hypothetical protein